MTSWLLSRGHGGDGHVHVHGGRAYGRDDVRDRDGGRGHGHDRICGWHEESASQRSLGSWAPWVSLLPPIVRQSLLVMVVVLVLRVGVKSAVAGYRRLPRVQRRLRV